MLSDTLRRASLGRAAAALCVVLLLGACSAAMGAIIPDGCTANALNQIITRSPSTAHNGDTITYNITIFNGPFPPACQVTDVVAYFQFPGADGSPDPASEITLETAAVFNPSDSVTYGPFLHTLALNPGVTSATAAGHFEGYLQDATPPDWVEDTKTVTVNILEPCIEVTKEVTPLVSKASDEVVYTICVTNCGNATLNDVTVVDTVLGDLSDVFSDVLLAGETECHDFTYIVKPDDDDPLINEVTAAGTDDLGLTVTDLDVAEVDLVHPDFTLTKTCDPDPTMVGDTMYWDVCVVNTGPDVSLDIHVVDASIGLDETVTLAPGEDMCWTRSRVMTAADMPSVSNEVVATATLDPATNLPNVLERRATATCGVEGEPCIEVTKTAEPLISKAGDDVTYTIEVCNCGTVPLTYVTVVDSLLGDVTSAFWDGLTLSVPTITLDPGECMTATLTRTVLADDPDPLVNVVTATGTDPAGVVVEDTDEAVVDLVHPDFTLTKTCGPDPTMVGENMTWTVCVENTGDVGLDIHVVDASLGLDYSLSLAPNDIYCEIVMRMVTVGDLPSVSNEAVATATLDPATNLPNVLERRATAECAVEGEPCIEVTKTAEPLVSKAGDDVAYYIEVCNCGTVPLTDVTVVDSLLGDVTAAFPHTTLEPDQCMDAFFTRTVLETDPDPLVNVVTATGTDPAGVVVTDEDDAVVDLVHPDFTLTKTCAPDPLWDGDIVTWTITLTNTGDVDLLVDVVDALGYTEENIALPVGDIASWELSYQVVCPDDSPSVSNMVTATATLAGVDLPNILVREAMDSCRVICEGPTRTPGYWFTHPDATYMALAEDCPPYIAGGMFLLPPCCEFDIADAMRVFWMGVRELEPNVRRTLGMHIMAAMCNACLLETEPPAGIIEDGIAVFCDPCATALEIGIAIEPLDFFNNSGTDLEAEILEGLNADPATAKHLASQGDISCAQGECMP